MQTLHDAEEALSHIIPFVFLPAEVRAALAARLEERRFSDGELIVRAGERSRAVFLLAEGRVETLAPDGAAASIIEAGHYFGERAALFDQPRQVTVRAAGAVRLLALPALDFLGLIDTQPTFAQALASSLTVKQGLFLGYRRLWALIVSHISAGGFLLSALLPAYRALHPALHPLLDSEQIDTGALAYATARLPVGVTNTTFYFLTASLPPLYTDPDEKFTAVPTRARRRAAWALSPGKLLILLRDGMSDITDFLTCLCLYAVEARKIRRRTRSSALLRALKQRQEGAAVPDAELEALSCLQPGELDGLRRIWGGALWDRIRDILLHHEDIALECDFLIDNYNASAAERWARQIRAVAGTLVPLDSPELRVHLISSNTHSVGNCLSPYVARRRDDILAWGRQHYPALVEAPWADQSDLLYALMRHHIEDVDGAYVACVEEERAAGHYRLTSTAFTGIAVDLICLQSVEPGLIDPALSLERPAAPTLIVNVDYAFGQQAEEILSNLLFVFSRSVRSVSVLGKAGGLVGHRGELLLPRATLLQNHDELYPLPNADLSEAALRKLAGGRAVHCGPVLTVTGTLLQNRPLLHFYRRIWKCVGLEMEGSFFARKLISAIETGIARPDVAARFAYYTSDVPLEPEENLSASMTPAEGIPPLYAITRAVLQAIFDQEPPPGDVKLV